MSALTRQQGVSAWYRPTLLGSSGDVAAEAYTDAVQFFERELTDDQHKRDWIRGQSSLADVCRVVEQTKRTYDAGSEKTKRVRKWLNLFATRVTYYGAVLDTLAQHHPEYVALAWGALKFLFSGVLNHAELVVELSKALTMIAEVLPRIKLDGSLYPTDHMKAAISRVYAHIILFLQKAVTWYTKGTARRIASSLFKPYSLSYKDTVDEIKKCTESVDAIASSAARAETRDLNITIQEQGVKLRETDKTLHDMRDHLVYLQASAQRTEAQLTQIWQLARNHYDITHTIKLDVTDQKARICDIQFSRILDVLGVSRSPEDVLQTCQSIAKRRHSWRLPGRESAIFIQRLGDWVSMSGSSMFVVEAGPRAKARAKDLAVEVTGLLKSTDYAVFWYLSEPIMMGRACTLESILKYLIYQALRHDSTIVSADPTLGNIVSFQMEHSLAEWLSLTCLIFSKIPKCFMIIEKEDLYRISGRDSALAQQILQIFQQVLNGVSRAGGIMKMLIVSYGRDSVAAMSSGDIPLIVAGINQSLPVSRLLKRHYSQRARSGLERHHLQPRLSASQRAEVSTR